MKMYFSLQEVNEIIKKVKEDVTKIIQLRDELDLLDNTKIEFDEANVENFLLEVELNKSFHEKNIELYSTIGKLIRLGCIIKNLDDMEIDFYSKLDNKDILFCWHPEDEKILFWHYPGEEHAKRKPVQQIEKKYFEQLKKLR